MARLRSPDSGSADPNATIRSGWLGGMLLKCKYELVERLGRGAFGEVWKAKDLEASDEERDVFVALKLLPPELAGSPTEITQVRKNFQKVHDLHHQNIVAHLAMFQDGDDCALVMELVDGVTLRNQGTLPPDEALRICRQIAEGLDYAHSRHVVHRDVKPDNIMLTPRGEVKILDFGLAAEIRSSMSRLSKKIFDTAGTRPYMAPELWISGDPSSASDQYALGVVLYELLSGRPPFQSDDAGVLRECVLRDAPKPLASLSPDQNAALRKALAKDPKDRYTSCCAFIKAVAGETPEKENSPATPASRKRAGIIHGLIRRRRRLVLLLVLVLWLLFRHYRDKTPQAPPPPPAQANQEIENTDRSAKERTEAVAQREPLPVKEPEIVVNIPQPPPPVVPKRVIPRVEPAPLPTVSSGETATYRGGIVVVEPDAHLGPGFGNSPQPQELEITPSYPAVR